MRDRQDIDEVLRDWPFEPDTIRARLVRAYDGRQVLQMRIEMGLLQMETAGRPDGEQPGGAETYLDYLIQEAVRREEEFELTESECLEVDREFLQFYHRRICWLALRQFKPALQDADHTLELMDFVQAHSPNEEWTLSHEQYRPFVLFQRTQAAALAGLDRGGPEAAIEEINQGLKRLQKLFDQDHSEEPFDKSEVARQLRQLRESIRQRYEVGWTLAEQLADAVASEQYELAARLRDEIARRAPRL
jgi:hypothetical protein